MADTYDRFSPPLPQAPLPRDRFWTDSHEQQFQWYMANDPAVKTWREAFIQKYGQPPTMEGGDFDYRKAWLAGDGPRAVPYDSVPHWGSTGKQPDHPTAWMNDFLKMYGVDPYQAAANPTPETTKALNDQVGSFGIQELLRGLK